MGVQGLWRLLDASGKPVPLETLEGKVLAIDVSIWIHQVLQGYQDKRGSVVPNAHLLGLFHRICKLLYFKIKPVFVFDGGVPMLKKNTIASRKRQKAIAANKAQQMKHDLIHNLIKRTAVKGALAIGKREEQTNLFQDSANSSSNNSSSVHDMFKLPSMPVQNESLSDESMNDYEYESDSSMELSPRKQSRWKGNIHNVDVTSADFQALPADVRYDVLTDLKETRKQNSWGRLHEMPEESHQFSDFQMKRLLKRRRVQESLESAEREMGGKTLTLEELEKLLNEQGIGTSSATSGINDDAYRIAADSTTRLIFINDPKALKKSSMSERIGEQSSSQDGLSIEPRVSQDPDDDQPSILTSTTSTSTTDAGTTKSIIADINEYDLNNDWDSDSDIEAMMPTKSVEPSPLLTKKYFGQRRFNPALDYMLEHADLEQDQILALIEGNKEKSSSSNDIVALPKQHDSQSVEKSDFSTTREKESNIEASASKSISAFDSLLFEISQVGDDRIIEKSSSTVEAIGNTSIEPGPIESSIDSPKPLSSDSDTDSDLIEIQDVPIPDAQSSGSLEILVKSDQALKDEEDIFADVFERDSSPMSARIPQSISSKLDCTRSGSIQDMKMTSRTEDSKKSEIAIDVKIVETAHTDQPSAAIDIVLSDVDDICEASISRAEELSDQVAKFKPELLRASQDKLVSMEAELESEHSDLTENIGKLERQATAVTDQMRIEAQDLLRLFGIPYIVAPMEAEAQCAYLESIELTDGTITDDSDIWLFGGRCVYKNFFNNNKRVMQYKSNDIEHHFKLTRRQMIQLALLVGSDYTMGVSGIGPVTALEVLAAFPADGEDLLRGLVSFCSWIKTGRSAGPGRTTLRNKLRNVEIEKGFPSQAVVQAYLFPTVDESREAFTWSKPNLTLLSDYTRQKFGWTRLKFEETVGPVVKKLAEIKSQMAITSYFRVNNVPASIESTMSKRVQKAVERLGNVAEKQEGGEEEEKEVVEGGVGQPEKSVITKPSQKRRGKKSSSGPSVKTEPVEEKDSPGCSTKFERIKQHRNDKNIVDEYIPQRERDRANALKKKLRAIELFRKSKKGLGRGRKSQSRSAARITKKEVELSESSDTS